jgi:hypothetical protein
MLAKKKKYLAKLNHINTNHNNRMPCVNGRVTVRNHKRKGVSVSGYTRRCPAKAGKKANYTKYQQKQKMKRIKNRFLGAV